MSILDPPMTDEKLLELLDLSEELANLAVHSNPLSNYHLALAERVLEAVKKVKKR